MTISVVVVSGHRRIDEGGGVESCLRALRQGLRASPVSSCFVLGKAWHYRCVSVLVILLIRLGWKRLDVMLARLHIAGIHANLRRQSPVLVPGQVFHCHDVFSVLACVRLARERGVSLPIIYTVHAPYFEQVLINHPSPAYRQLAWSLEQQALAACVRVLCVSAERVATVVAKNACVCPVEVLPNSVDETALRRSAQEEPLLPIPTRPFFLVPRHLYRVSGVHVAIEALDDYRRRYSGEPSVLLVVAGDGEERRHLEQQIVSLGLERQVLLLGKVSHGELIKLMHHAEAVMLPSVPVDGYVDGCPMSMFEAMALGRPLIVSACGGIADVLQGTDAALLCSPGDAGAFADALHRVLHDPSFCESMVRKGTILYAENYGFSAWIERHLQVYRLAEKEVACGVK